MQDWVFDSASTFGLEQFINQSGSPAEVKDFSTDVRTINWKNYVMNHAYGVKHYVL